MPAVEMHAVCHGEVQGVGLRYTIKNLSERLELTGWVKNLPEGTVELEVQGEKGKLDLLVKQIKSLPPPIHVEKIDTEFLKPEKEFSGFIILR